MRSFQLDEDERKPVDEAEEVSAPLVEIAFDPELRYEQELVVLGVLPIDDIQPLHRLAAIGLTDGDGHAVSE